MKSLWQESNEIGSNQMKSNYYSAYKSPRYSQVEEGRLALSTCRSTYYFSAHAR